MVLSASSDAVVGNAPVRGGAVAGGLQATTPQTGGALGTPALSLVGAVLVAAGMRVGAVQARTE
ncbi:hypothetical protein [Streptomyces sp. NPDC046942]|uniref:hypothetical protein n=1 Tax=Streptomyces sp. NPDC046942 TaxID=3155137 RepID=UPI0033F6B168